MEKICSRCGILKDEKKFGPDKRRPDGRTITCRNCYKHNQLEKFFRTEGQKESQRKKLTGRKYTIEHRLAISKGQKKAVAEGRHPFYKHGISGKEDGRKNIHYQIWREQVLENFGNKCCRCEKKENLHCHHIKCYYEHPELRYDVTNGQIFCLSCHVKFHFEEKKKLKAGIKDGPDHK